MSSRKRTAGSQTNLSSQQSVTVMTRQPGPETRPLKVLVTAGPTREYLDDVRYLSNASSGLMGYEIAAAIRRSGHDVVLVSGPVSRPTPEGVQLVSVESTSEMADACRLHFPACNGAIGVAAVCDYRPVNRHSGKLAKSGGRLVLELEETEDILASLGDLKTRQWIIGFALEPEAVGRENALRKLRQKNCDAIVLNHPESIGSPSNRVTVLLPDGSTGLSASGSKADVASQLWAWWLGHLSGAGYMRM